MNNVIESLEEYFAVDQPWELLQRTIDFEQAFEGSAVVIGAGFREPEEPKDKTSLHSGCLPSMLVAGQNQRARAVRAHGRLAVWEWYVIREFEGGRCIYCRCRCNPTIEHFIPLSRGGSGSADNIVPACKGCNASKNARPVEEWAAEKGIDLHAVNGRRGAILAALYAEGQCRAQARR
jgi:hypothetical protein